MCAKEIRLVEIILMNVFWKINNLIMQNLLKALRYVKSKTQYEKKNVLIY